MSATVLEPALPAAAHPPRRARPRGGALVGGVLAGLAAVTLLAAGALGLWADARKDGDGFLSTRTERLATTTYALRSQSLDAELQGPRWLTGAGAFGTVRVQATAGDGKRVFVGVARTADVDRYLRGIAHATVTDLDLSPLRARYRTSAGGGPVTEPWEQDFWAAASYGAGTRELTWHVGDGDWSVVVMNADGMRGVDAAVRLGAELPLLEPLAWALLGGGTLLLLTAGGLFLLATGRPRPRP